MDLAGTYTPGGAGQEAPVGAREAGVAGAAPAPALSRVAWLDAARGLGIVLVVIGHALGGLIDSRLGGGLLLRQAQFAIYTFHMPLFFLLAGLTVERRVARGAGSFVAALLPSLAWPYVLWSVIQFTAVWAAGPLVNRPAGGWWDTVLALPWHPLGQFWFLHALLCLHGIAALVLPRLGREGLLLLALVLRPLAAVVPLDPAVRVIVLNFAWYAIGVWLGIGGLQGLVVNRVAWVRAAALPLGAVVLVWLTLRGLPLFAPGAQLGSASATGIALLAWSLPAGAAALGGALAAVALASWPLLHAGGVLAALGRKTMPIYLLHIMALAGARIALMRAGVTVPGLLVALPVAAGLAGPLVAAAAARRLGVARALGLGHAAA